MWALPCGAMHRQRRDHARFSLALRACPTRRSGNVFCFLAIPGRRNVWSAIRHSPILQHRDARSSPCRAAHGCSQRHRFARCSRPKRISSSSFRSKRGSPISCVPIHESRSHAAWLRDGRLLRSRSRWSPAASTSSTNLAPSGSTIPILRQSPALSCATPRHGKPMSWRASLNPRPMMAAPCWRRWAAILLVPPRRKPGYAPMSERLSSRRFACSPERESAWRRTARTAFWHWTGGIRTA